MITTKQLLAAAKANQGIPSNYRLARILEVPDNTVQRWSSGISRPDDKHCARLAEMAGLDAGIVIASIRAEREEPNSPLRAVWEGIADRLQRAAAVVGVVAAGTLLSAPMPSPAQGRTADPSEPYVNSGGRRRRQVAAALGRSLPQRLQAA